MKIEKLAEGYYVARWGTSIVHGGTAMQAISNMLGIIQCGLIK